MQGSSSARLKPLGTVHGRDKELMMRPSPVDYPIRLGPSQHGGLSFPGLKDVQAQGSVLPRRQTLTGVTDLKKSGFGESLSSSGQLSIDYSVGDGKYGPVRMKPPAETGVGRRLSGGSESIGSLTRNRSLSSSGTIRTAGSSVERRISWGTKKWVKESRAATHTSPFSSPRLAEAKHATSGNQNSSLSPREGWVGYCGHPRANKSGASADIPAARKGMIERADYHWDPQLPTRSLVVSPRNQPAGHDEITPDCTAFENLPWHRPEHRNGQDIPVGNRSAGTGKAAEHAAAEHAAAEPKKDGATMSGWTGLTKDTMELLLKLREDEEVRLLRQRAVTRWLNHLPIPSKFETMDTMTSSRASEISSLALIDSSELDSILDSTQLTGIPPVDDSKPVLVDDKYNQPSLSRQASDVGTSAGHVQNSFSRSNSLSCGGPDVAVDKPEFEFVDIVDPDFEVHDNFASDNQLSSKKASSPVHAVQSHHTPFSSIPSFEEGQKTVENLSRLSYGSYEKYSGELVAIPEVDGGSAGNEEDEVEDGSSYRRPNLALVRMNSCLESDLDEIPQRPPSAAERWTTAFSSIEQWVGSRRALKSLDANADHAELCGVGPEPDLEIAVDVQERLNSLARSRSLGPLSDEALTPKTARKHTYSPIVKDTKDGGLGWCFSDDCDSSRIAAGSQPTDASKSPRTRQHTQLLSPRSSMYSDEGGLRFHVKYSIPEDEVVTGSKSLEEDESELLETNITDLLDVPVAANTMPVTLMKRNGKGTMLSDELGSLTLSDDMDCQQCDSAAQELDRRNDCWTGPSEDDCAEECRDAQDVGSSNPQATYWLPDFCQNNTIEPLDLSNKRDSRPQPSTWHVNPLSLSGGDKRRKLVSRPNSSRGSSPSEIPAPYPLKKVDSHSHVVKRVQFHSQLDHRPRTCTRPPTQKRTRMPPKNSHRNKPSDQSKTSCTKLFGFIAALCTSRK